MGCSTAPAPHGVRNLAVVDSANVILRGGQPDNEGWDYLGAAGIVAVAKLDGVAEGMDDPRFKIFFLPLTWEQQVGIKRMAAGSVERLVMALPAERVFMHCLHGQDRTGLVVAVWRVLREGWTVEAAEGEMLALGFHRELHGLWEYWEGFKQQRNKGTKNESR